ncbi:MAG: 16S rRNA (cytosine(1402)-N(4))-methyltransferase RsmH [Endomicrobiales bacterium]|nr:16S rRNA (cytosine(1402)-N(4))-methyltransferase RsmH [Endomicrobiales bacterium]
MLYTKHVPVMINEVDNYLINKRNGLYVDCTLGDGGHSGYLLNKYPHLNILAFDWDEDSVKAAKNNLEKYNNRITVVRENYKNIGSVVKSLNINYVDGLLIDLGASSNQLENTDRGFSFKSSVLDMRMDARLSNDAKDLLNNLDEERLSDIFYKFGEERFSRPIARLIVQERQKQDIVSGNQLSSIVIKAKKNKNSKIHPATKVFQALRIAVNGELRNIEEILKIIPDILTSGSRVVILSYHSLEDRIVKVDFRENHKNGKYKLLTKKVVCPSAEEVDKNPKSRSAKLRAVERL